MFTGGHWGNIRVPGGGGGTSVDLTPLLNRLTALEATDVSHQVQMDDLDLQVKLLNGKVEGDQNTGGDDPGLSGTVATLQGELYALRTDNASFHSYLDASFTELASSIVPDLIRLKETVFDKETYPQAPGLTTKFAEMQTTVTGLQGTASQHENVLFDHAIQINNLNQLPARVDGVILTNNEQATAITDLTNRTASLEGFRGQQGTLNTQVDEQLMDLDFQMGHVGANLNTAKQDIVNIKAQLAKPSPDVSWDVFVTQQTEWNQIKENQVTALDQFRTSQLEWKEEQQMTNLTFYGDLQTVAIRAEEAHTRITENHPIMTQLEPLALAQ